MKPEECLLFIEKINKKRFLNRLLYVTSVVADSPVKKNPAESVTVNKKTTSSIPTPKLNLPVSSSDTSYSGGLYLGKPLTPRQNATTSSSSADNTLEDEFELPPVSSKVQEKLIFFKNKVLDLSFSPLHYQLKESQKDPQRILSYPDSHPLYPSSAWV